MMGPTKFILSIKSWSDDILVRKIYGIRIREAINIRAEALASNKYK